MPMKATATAVMYDLRGIIYERGGCQFDVFMFTRGAASLRRASSGPPNGGVWGEGRRVGRAQACERTLYTP